MTSIILDYPQDHFGSRMAHLGQRIPRLFKAYLTSFFPIFQWIHRYRFSWLLQDMIAGLTVGIVLVPQSIAYSKVATLPAQYGLYTSFVGVSIYCFFGTSKDISVGMTSTVSLMVGKAIGQVQAIYPDIPSPQIAVTLSLATGLITLLIGICRLGILIDFIPQPAIAGYMTGSAITIVLGQLPKLFGLNTVNTRDSPYLIIIDFFKSLPLTKLDVAFGLTSLVLLYLVRFGSNYASHRFQNKGMFYFGIMRNGLVVILGTLASFLVNRGKKANVISIIKNVPPGFDALAVPMVDWRILPAASSILPSILLLMVLEHVSVAKSFGSIYDYTISPNQEIFSIGISNILGSFFGGPPSTGTFSRTAINAKSGVKTPCGGMFSALVVVLALYALTPCFYYIPDAVLSAVVIHAVADLVSSPSYLKSLYNTSLLECLIWFSAVVVTVFLDIQMGIYVAVGLSLVIMLLRSARPPVNILSRVSSLSPKMSNPELSDQHYVYVDEKDPNYDQQSIVPLPSGLLIFQLVESMLYPNANAICEAIRSDVKARTQCGASSSHHDIPWSQQVPEPMDSTLRLLRPVLRGIILDLSAAHRMDSTALTTLANLRKTLDTYAGQTVEWHFAGLRHNQLRRNLIYHGFGEPICNNNITDEKQTQHSQVDLAYINSADEEIASVLIKETSGNRLPRDKCPHFHWDIDTAVHFINKRWNNSS